MSRQQGADVFGEKVQKGKKSVVFHRRHCCKYRYLLSTVDGPAASVSSVAQIPHDNKYKDNGALLCLVVQPDISSTPQQLPTSAPNYPATQMGALAPQYFSCIWLAKN